MGSEEGFFVKVGIPEGLDESDGGAEPSNDGPFEIVGLADGTDVGSLETGLSVVTCWLGCWETEGGTEPSNDGPFEIVGFADGSDVGSCVGLFVGDDTGLSVGLFVLG